MFQAPGDGYYFRSSSQLNSNLTYQDMRYCNSCTQNTFPTNILSGFQYGLPDFTFYARNTLTPAPTVTALPNAGLAIRLLGISARNAGSSNVITWRTATEDAGDSFTLERSTDGIHFTPLYHTTAAGAANSYTYTDSDCPTGISYYRLRLYTARHAAGYSMVVSAKIAGEGRIATLWPNPCTGTITLSLTGIEEGTFTLYSLTGQVLQEVQVTGAGLTINTQNLAPGNYIVRYSNGDYSKSFPLTKAAL